MRRLLGRFRFASGHRVGEIHVVLKFLDELRERIGN